MAAAHTLFTDMLTVLRVPHTDAYSRKRFETMPFNTLFGLSKLLQEYGVDGAGYRLAPGTDLLRISPPYLLQTKSGFVIVCGYDGGRVRYLTEGVEETIDAGQLDAVSTGIVYVPQRRPDAREPDYRQHRMLEMAAVGKRVGLAIGLVSLFLYFFIVHRIYARPSTVLLTVFSLTGLYFSLLLMQKSIGVKNRRADRVCGVLESGGCDQVLKLKASTFFGIVSWSDVGVTYFSVTLAVLMLWPGYLPYLALFNVCCLPFTCWSVWYQKFRAHHWCTMCLCVQATLWCLFICFLSGGWFSRLDGIGIAFFVIGVGYFTVLLLLSQITTAYKKRIKDGENS